MSRPPRSPWRLATLAPAVALAAGGIKLVSMHWLSNEGAAAYADADFERSRSLFERVDVLNVIEPWRVPFGVGGSRYRSGDLLGAEAAFGAAFELAPERCEIRFNLAVTIEAEGDALMAGRSLEVEDIEELNPLSRYTVARDLITAGTCPSRHDDDAGARLAEALERINRKLGGEQLDGAAPELPGDDTDQPEGGESDEQLRQLDERAQIAAAQRDEVSDLYADPRPPSAQPHW